MRQIQETKHPARSKINWIGFIVAVLGLLTGPEVLDVIHSNFPTGEADAIIRILLAASGIGLMILRTWFTKAELSASEPLRRAGPFLGVLLAVALAGCLPKGTDLSPSQKVILTAEQTLAVAANAHAEISGALLKYVEGECAEPVSERCSNAKASVRPSYERLGKVRNLISKASSILDAGETSGLTELIGEIVDSLLREKTSAEGEKIAVDGLGVDLLPSIAGGQP